MKIYIKYMVSNRCKMLVSATLKEMGLHSKIVELGEVETFEDLTPLELDSLKVILLKSGLELMDDKRAIVIEKIKKVVIEMIHFSGELPKVNFSDYLVQKLNQPYHHLAVLFSEVTGITLEHYLIINRIERAKELLLYDELSLTQIADTLGYSSVAHLSNQFKKVTGLTPTVFKRFKSYKQRISLENL